MAEQVRTGLTVSPELQLAEFGSSVLDELFAGKAVRRHVREFGALFGLIALGVACWALYGGKSQELVLAAITAALLFIVTGYQFPRVLHPVWKAWMAFAHLLGTVMTSVLLFILWFAMLVPIGLVLRVCRVEVMDMAFRKPVDSYWLERKEKKHSFKLLELQY